MGWGRGDAQKHQHQDSSRLGAWGMLPWWLAGSHRPSTKGTCLPALGPHRVSPTAPLPARLPGPPQFPASTSDLCTDIAEGPAAPPSCCRCHSHSHPSQTALGSTPLLRVERSVTCGASLWRGFLHRPHVNSPTLAFQPLGTWMVRHCPGVGKEGPRDTFPRLKVARYCWEDGDTSGHYFWLSRLEQSPRLQALCYRISETNLGGQNPLGASHPC